MYFNTMPHLRKPTSLATYQLLLMVSEMAILEKTSRLIITLQTAWGTRLRF